MAAPPPAVLEHALMKDANNPAAPRDAGKITVALGDNLTKTIIRTGVDIKPDMCIWRGVVEETGCARHADVVAERPDGRHGAGAGPHLFDPPHGRVDLRHDRDGRRSHAAGACADAGPPALRRPQCARRSPGQPGRRQPAAAPDARHARSRGAGREVAAKAGRRAAGGGRAPPTSSSTSSSPTPGRPRPTTPTSRASSSTSPSRKATSRSA